MGRAIADKLVADGGKVHVTSRSSEKIASSGFPGTVCDVFNESDIESSVEEAGSQLTGLVFAVGSIVLKPLKALGAKDFIDTFMLNAVSAAMAAKKASPTLKANRGAILFFSTVAVGRGFANHSAISAAKGAVEGMTRSLAAELAPDVRVNCLSPSLTNTNLATSMTSNAAMAAALAKMHPLGRLGLPEDFGPAGAFLVSQSSSWITGQVIGIDGGRGALAGK